MILDIILPNRRYYFKGQRRNSFLPRKRTEDKPYIEKAMVIDDFGTVVHDGIPAIHFFQNSPDYQSFGMFESNGVLFHRFILIEHPV